MLALGQLASAKPLRMRQLQREKCRAEADHSLGRLLNFRRDLRTGRFGLFTGPMGSRQDLAQLGKRPEPSLGRGSS